ncbi:hypothetical protein GCM10009854_01900 [Saccharopolyspora halophila]|uniref:ESX-1 secretion-associated protein n=1 Tax=Saccharopolyspora halophila TaxID=405551 RepID=A0ABN3FHR5_9PSEU
MPGIRVDVDVLSTCARQVRAAGEEITETTDHDLRLDPTAFGELGHGAAEAYARLCSELLGRRERAAEALTEAGDGLRAVVDAYTGGDDDGAGQLRGQER